MQLVARTADLDEIRSVMAGMFGTHRLMMPAYARPDAKVEAREVGQLLLARVRYGMPIEVEVDETRVAWTITQIVRGTGEVDRRRRADACGDVLTHSPEWCGRIGASADLLFDNLRIPVAKLDATCRILLGSELDRPVLLENRRARGVRHNVRNRSQTTARSRHAVYPLVYPSGPVKEKRVSTFQR